VDPIEINAGRYYLRALRADTLIDDRPALAEAFADDGVRAVRQAFSQPVDPDAYVAAKFASWRDGTCCSWAIAEPTTGRLLGEAGLVIGGDGAVAYCWTLPGERRKGVAVTALAAVLRFGEGALDLRTIRFRHRGGDVAAARLAAACGLVRANSEPAAGDDRVLTEWRKEPELNSA
jgi:RimJ/RimL family protein N-acetyltransferase